MSVYPHAEHLPEARLTGLLETMSDAYIALDSAWRYTYVNGHACRIMGCAREDLLGRSIWEVMPELTALPFYEACHRAMRERLPLSLEGFHPHYDVWLEERIHPVNDGLGIFFSDISQRIHFQQELARQANYDTLTGLPNRSLLEQHLEQMIRQAKRNGHLVGVAFIDLDQFKSVNDTIGHHVGDLLLKATAERFKASIRSCDLVARLGGDEFVVVCPDIHALSDMEEVVSRLYLNLRAPLTIGNNEIAVDASIGISGYPADGMSVSDLLKCADMAMYSAKAAGRGSLKFYRAEIGARVALRLGIEQELRRALVNHEFVLHYQPKIDARSGAICGVEALIRWNHPRQGLVAPAYFIEIAEESKLIIPIGEWVLHEACRQNQAWIEAGLSDFPVSVNVSMGQFKHLDFSETVSRSLSASGMAANRLDLEITESLAMEGPELFIAMLERIKRLGVSISIDDFGTGYSSLSYIKRFPIDVLKIDRSFVSDIPGDDDDAAICRTIINMAHNLKLRVVAEGVETLEQTRYLQAHACDELQGFLLCRPEPAAAIHARLLQRRSWLPG